MGIISLNQSLKGKEHGSLRPYRKGLIIVAKAYTRSQVGEIFVALKMC